MERAQSIHQQAWSGVTALITKAEQLDNKYQTSFHDEETRTKALRSMQETCRQLDSELQERRKTVQSMNETYKHLGIALPNALQVDTYNNQINGIKQKLTDYQALELAIDDVMDKATHILYDKIPETISEFCVQRPLAKQNKEALLEKAQSNHRQVWGNVMELLAQAEKLDNEYKNSFRDEKTRKNALLSMKETCEKLDSSLQKKREEALQAMNDTCKHLDIALPKALQVDTYNNQVDVIKQKVSDYQSLEQAIDTVMDKATHILYDKIPETISEFCVQRPLAKQNKEALLEKAQSNHRQVWGSVMVLLAQAGQLDNKYQNCFRDEETRKKTLQTMQDTCEHLKSELEKTPKVDIYNNSIDCINQKVSNYQAIEQSIDSVMKQARLSNNATIQESISELCRKYPILERNRDFLIEQAKNIKQKTWIILITSSILLIILLAWFTSMQIHGF